MRRLALPLLLAFAPALARAAETPRPQESALATAADRLAAELGRPPAARRALVLSVESRAPALAAPAAAALEAALARAGWAVIPARGADPEAAARDAGHDWALRVQAGLVPGRPELALVGQLLPAWRSFFLQRRPGAHAVPPRLVHARAPADPEALLLAREARPAGAPLAILRPLATVAGRVLALAAGPVADGGTAIAAALPDGVVLLSADGAMLARRGRSGEGAAPVRSPAATIAIAAGRVAVRHAGDAAGELLALQDGALEPEAALGAAPLCASRAAVVYGAFAPGKGVLEDAAALAPDAVPAAASGRERYGWAAAPGGGAIAVAALGTDLRLDLLGPDLAQAAPPLDGIGAGFALADLDGDGAAELVASTTASSAPDALRVLAPGPGGARPLLELGPVDGLLLAGAAGDLTGDGLDDAVLAAVGPGEGGAPITTLLLVTGDPRELR